LLIAVWYEARDAVMDDYATSGFVVILIFSNLAEALKDGPEGRLRARHPALPRRLRGDRPQQAKPGSDNIDPRDYMKRLEDWKVRVEASGGHWRVINDLDRLDPAFLG
jgi:hypothetical protein